MLRLSRFVLRHKLAVVLCWLAVLVAGGAASSRLTDRLAQDFAFPGQPGYEANVAILEAYGNGGPANPLVPVVTLPAGTTVDSPGVRAMLGQVFDRLEADPRGRLRVLSYASSGDRGLVSADGRTTFAVVSLPYRGQEGPDPTLAPAIADALRRALPPGTTVRVTGLDELSSQAAGGRESGVLAETLLGGLGALVVLAFVFGSALALVPLLVALFSILGTFLVVLGLSEVTDVNFIIQYLIALIGLGVAIDYSLLVVTRWREERAAGHDAQAAVHRAMRSAGRAVVFSAATVAVSLVVLAVVPVPFLRSVGFGSMLIPLVSTLVSVTLLPVLLATVGPWLDRSRRRRDPFGRSRRLWTRWATAVTRHPWLAVLAALAILVPLGVGALGLRLGQPTADSLTGTGPARAGLLALERGRIPSGVLTPIEVLLPAGADPAQASARLAQVPGVHTATAPSGPGWRRDASALVSVLPAAETSTDAGKATLERVRDAAAELPGARVGGTGALDVDATHALYGAFPAMLAVVALATFVLLARAFHSLLLPAKAVVLNLLSIGAAYGVLVLVWQRGYGSSAIWGIDATGAIVAWVPLMTFAFLYGLSMDYEVFLLTRMREAYNATGSTQTAVVEGLGRVGRLVTSAALILFLAFAALASVPAVDVKVMATGLGAGILLDATVLRALLMPAAVVLLGRWNWWLPTWTARLLRLPPIPTGQATGRPPVRQPGP
ncbi:MAG TPA: MMPL family transporter [Actinomycetes bacterium]|nr:MMPL family transporter [Actinomycetes bacterium]